MRITLIGAGNVGTHLALALHRADHEIIQVHSRADEKARLLAEQVEAGSLSDLTKLDEDIDVCILAVKDDVISSVFDQIRKKLSDVLVLHTAGSVSVDIFKGHLQYGVIWPVQTLSIAHPIDFRQVPLAIAGNNAESTYFIETLARSISEHVYRLDDTSRAFLHLAATFASNFSNHMYFLAARIAHGQDIPFDILKPLIQETARKIQDMSPDDAQTGPAIRNDRKTLLRHLMLLEGKPDMEEIYQLITKSIQASGRQDGI